MKRTLFVASIIGIFMAATMDLQAHHRRQSLPRLVRDGIALLGHASTHHRHDRYAQYSHHRGREIAREIRRNEKRIWKLEKRIDRVGHHRGGRWEILELEREIDMLQRRNDYLRSLLY